MHYRSPFRRGLKLGLFLAALIVLAWLIWGKGIFDDIFSRVKSADRPTESRIEKTSKGTPRKKVEKELGDPQSTEANCSIYKSQEGATYRLCFKRGKLRTINTEQE